MLWSIPILSVKGTVIRIHVTFLLFLAWIGIAHWVIGGADAALEGVLFIVLLFLCVLLHEFGHVFAARRYGVQTPDITLLPIGGVARLERIPERPSQELVVALAGPAVNVVIALVLFLILGSVATPEDVAALGQEGLARVEDPRVSLLARLASVNVFLVLFNLIPAFPMDGGRVLRAVLAMRMPYARATGIAASIGQGVAFVLGFIGLFGNPLLVFVAIFVYLAAASESQAAQMRQVGQGLLVTDAMITQFESLSPASRVEDAVQCLIRTTQHEFPVVDGGGRLRGVLTRTDMIRALKDRGAETPVLEVMHAEVPMIHHRQPLEAALRVMQERSAPAVGVTGPDDRLIGLVTPENVGELMMVHAARPQRPTGGGGPRVPRTGTPPAPA